MHHQDHSEFHQGDPENCILRTIGFKHRPTPARYEVVGKSIAQWRCPPTFGQRRNINVSVREYARERDLAYIAHERHGLHNTWPPRTRKAYSQNTMSVYPRKQILYSRKLFGPEYPSAMEVADALLGSEVDDKQKGVTTYRITLRRLANPSQVQESDKSFTPEQQAFNCSE